MEMLLVVLVGLSFGSFATMASYRLPREKPITSPRSHCTHCQTSLTAKDLVPVLSWGMNKGKCRHCGASVSGRYPLIELLCAGLFAGLYLKYGLTVSAAILALFGTALLVMLVADLETRLIPDEIHFFLIPLGILWHWHQQTPLTDVVAATLLAGGIGLLLHYGYYFLRGRHGLGFGDVKFLFVAGLWLASLHLLSAFIFYSGMLGIVTGVLWKFFHEDPRFPFAPSLAISLFLLVIWPQLAQLFWQVLRGWLL